VPNFIHTLILKNKFGEWRLGLINEIAARERMSEHRLPNVNDLRKKQNLVDLLRYGKMVILTFERIFKCHLLRRSYKKQWK
jgi:hypothetical protein